MRDLGSEMHIARNQSLDKKKQIQRKIRAHKEPPQPFLIFNLSPKLGKNPTTIQASVGALIHKSLKGDAESRCLWTLDSIVSFPLMSFGTLGIGWNWTFPNAGCLKYLGLLPPSHPFGIGIFHDKTQRSPGRPPSRRLQNLAKPESAAWQWETEGE